MKHLIICSTILLLSFCSWSQANFSQAYASYPSVPNGLLEAVSWTNTHMVHLNGNTSSCSGMPQAIGIMGLHDQGANYFKENALFVEQLSGISIQEQKNSADAQILAYASAYDSLITCCGQDIQNPNEIRDVLHQLSEIPDTGFVNLLAKDIQVFSILTFMNDAEKAQQYGFNQHHFNLNTIFGIENHQVLSSPTIKFAPDGIRAENGALFSMSAEKSLEYGPAIWNPAAPCNYSSRNGVAISAITIHTIQGTYAGAISWAQNCSSSVSYHYVVRSSDGQITQMLLEEEKGWHVGTENPYTIGYEHEGYVDDPSWYTEELYNASADLSRDIVNSGYGIPPLRTYYGAASVTTELLGNCTKIKGHQHYANTTHTDPGINWDWEKYYRLINNTYTPTTLTSPSGTLTDTGGSGGDYQDDEREFWLVEIPNTSSITLDFSVFNVESGYDNLFIYDGDSISDPLLGSYTGSNSPGIVTSSGGSILLEFRSDCASVSNGWEATYTSVPFDLTAPTTDILIGQTWQTDDFSVSFQDTDSQSEIADRYYLIAESPITSSDWVSDGNYGFLNESFEVNDTNWNAVTGSFTVNSGVYTFNDIAEQNSNTYCLVEQNSASKYLYEWTQTFTSSDVSQRAGLHFFCDDATLTNRGNSYFVYLRESDDKIQIFSVDNDVFTMESEVNLTIDESTSYNCKVSYDPISGWILVYIDEVLVNEWQDLTPLSNGNSISIRTGGTSADFDDIRVYKSRSSQVNVTAGFGQEMSIESESATSTALINSIVIDSAMNWSANDLEYYLLDFSLPTIDYLNDGVSVDIDTFYTSLLEGNWNAIDIHSDIGSYEYAIGTLPNLDNIIPWTSNALLGTLGEILASPIYGETYHISVRVTNGAGLMDQFISNGQTYLEDLSLIENPLSNIVVYPIPASESINVSGIVGDCLLTIYDMNGKVCLTGKKKSLNIKQLESGKYNLMISQGDQFAIHPIIIAH